MTPNTTLIGYITNVHLTQQSNSLNYLCYEVINNNNYDILLEPFTIDFI